VPLTANTMALGGIQLGPDNKIYVARENNGFLGVINHPDVIGTGCDYVAEGVHLAGKTSNLGLPGFVASSLVQNQPYISSFSPMSGVAGDVVIISGIDFSSILSNNTVSFNGVNASVTEATANSLTVLVPEGANTGKISIESGCNLVSTTDDFTISSLGINDLNNEDVFVYPNPTTGIIRITSSENTTFDTIELVDIYGKKVGIVTENTNQLDISALANGIYLLKIYAGTTVIQKKIIKQ